MPRPLKNVMAQYSKEDEKTPEWVPKLQGRILPVTQFLREFLGDKNLYEHGLSLFKELLAAAMLDKIPSISIGTIAQGPPADGLPILELLELGSEQELTLIAVGVSESCVSFYYEGVWGRIV